MTNKLFVRGLPYSVDDYQLKTHFEQVGSVLSANVIIDRMNNRSKGFGFVEMSSAEEAQAAIQKFDNTELDGRTIYVQIAKPQEKRTGGFGNGRNDRRDNRGNRSNRY